MQLSNCGLFQVRNFIQSETEPGRCLFYCVLLCQLTNYCTPIPKAAKFSLEILYTPASQNYILIYIISVLTRGC